MLAVNNREVLKVDNNNIILLIYKHGIWRPCLGENCFELTPVMGLFCSAFPEMIGCGSGCHL
jgi:hypothetical protein